MLIGKNLRKKYNQLTLGLSTHFVRRLPRKFDLPKAFQTIRDSNRLAFLTLIHSIKRACFAALH